MFAPRQNGINDLATPVDDIKRITAQTLLVHGREDKVLPLSTSYELFSLLRTRSCTSSATAATGRRSSAWRNSTPLSPPFSAARTAREGLPLEPRPRGHRAARRARGVRRPGLAARTLRLTPAEIDAMLTADLVQLYALGANPYLIRFAFRDKYEN